MYSAKRQKFTKYFSLSIVPLAALFVIYETVTLPKISILIYLPHIPIVITQKLMIVHWWLTLHDLTQYSEQLLISIFKVKDRHGIAYRRRIWLQISNLSTEIGNATGLSALSYLTTNFVGFLLSMYGILINLNSPGSTNVPILGLILPAIGCAVTIFLKADAAYRATERVGSRFTNKLLQIDQSSLHRSSLNEFVSYSVTYLIVLLQMKTQPKQLKNDRLPDIAGNKTGFEALTLS
ncbi:unnamed protein product [Nezara viridula]|uniref:Uncharacterized protein n=1 Tax=Nezara viridula TaxID=85310 RepID=A0A9P0MQV6_NEZVI|nr:unnamed protein product [Nezara viridula]